MQGSRLEQHFGKMSSKRFCRRGCWEPYPHQAGPPPPRAHGAWDSSHDPPWEHQHWRPRGRMHLPGPRQPRPFPGPPDIHWNEENWREASRDCDVPPFSLDYIEDYHSPEEMFVKDLQPPNEDSLKTSSVQGSRLGQHFGKMSSKRFCRRGPRGCPWEPYPHQAGPPPPRAHGPWDAWHDPPWEHQHWRPRGRMHLPGPRQPRPFPGPPDIHWNEENWRWAPQNCEVPPPPWMDREDYHSSEEMFVKDLQPIPQLRHWDFFAHPEFPSQEQHPAGFPWEQEVFQDNFSPQRHCGPRRRRCRLLRPIRQETAFHSRSPQSSQGHHPSSKPSQSCSPDSQPGVKEHADAPQSPTACKNSLQSEEQVDEGLLVTSSEELEQPGHAEKSPEKSPGTDPQAAEQEPEAGSKPVEPEGGGEAAGSQQPSALELEPVSPEITITEEDEDFELAAGFQSLPRPPRSAYSPSSTDPRSAAILAKKESIEQEYHDFCVNFAMVSVMLLQKEPSMEVVLRKALKANLRELRNRLLRELEDFIQQYDVMHPSC